jgi:hypothetical protein
VLWLREFGMPCASLTKANLAQCSDQGIPIIDFVVRMWRSWQKLRFSVMAAVGIEDHMQVVDADVRTAWQVCFLLHQLAAGYMQAMHLQRPQLAPWKERLMLWLQASERVLRTSSHECLQTHLRLPSQIQSLGRLNG